MTAARSHFLAAVFFLRRRKASACETEKTERITIIKDSVRFIIRCNQIQKMMNKTKLWTKWIPEAFFALLLIGTFHPITIGLAVVLGVLFLIRKQTLPAVILGSILSVLFVMGSLYMTLALLSEYYEFETASWEAIRMFVVGMLIMGTSFVMGIVMLIKYLNYFSRIQYSH